MLIKGFKKDSRVLTLGDRKLYRIAKPVKKSDIKLVTKSIKIMHEILMAYKKEYDKFRAIAAPQIGLSKRFIYMHINKPVIMINPKLKDKSKALMTAWDDCMSFPDLMVKVKRHKRLTLEYYDLDWQKYSLKLNGDMAELIQHEYDHLDGILAVQRAIDLKSFAMYHIK